MKKYQILTGVFMALTSTISAQTIVNNSATRAEWGAHNSNILAVDVNNDGYRDLVLAGVGNETTNNAGGAEWEQKRMTHVITIDPNKRFRWYMVGNSSTSLNYFDEGIGFNVTDRPSLSACDINGDGIMDVVAFESTGRSHTDEPYLDNISREGIFLGNGDGTFVEFTPSFIDGQGNKIDFDIRTILSADVADLNNDGLTDIVGIGYQTNNSGDPKTYPDANVVLFNRGGGVFEVSHYLTADYLSAYGQSAQKYNFECGFVVTYDFNNDGYTDFFIISNSNDREALGTTDGDNTHFTDLFLNDPAHPGQFRRQFVTRSGMPAISEGGIAVADFNNDGTPDIFLSGWTGGGRGQYTYSVFTSTISADGGVSYTDRGTCGLSDMRVQNSTSHQYGTIDWDGDGNYDIFNAGWSPALNTQTCLIGHGNGAAAFSENTRLGGGSEGALTFVDWNGNGTNDYVTLTQSSDNSIYTSISSLSNVFSSSRNPNTVNTRPAMPTALTATAATDHITIAWQPAEGAKGNETYEYYVTDADGNIVAGGNSFIGDEKDGIRKVNQPGNAYNAHSVTLTLPQGQYTVGVQTINASYIGSTFATVTVDLTNSNIERTEPMVKPEPAVVTETYTNPVLNVSVPDPTVIRADDGTFYLYGTEDIHNVPIYKSTNLVDWDFVGTAFTDGTRPSMVPGGGIWAPDINKIGNQYVLYFSKSTWGGEWECGVGCAIADSPEGPFRRARKLFISNEIGVQNSIDPFYIEDNGHKYLFWGSFRGIYAIELSDNGLSVKSGAEKIKIADTLTEATYIIKHDGYYYLIGSAGTCCDGVNSTYRLMVARSKDLLGPYVSKTGEPTLSNGFSNLLFRSPNVVGPGHNSEIITDDAGQYWVLYHGYDAKDIDGGRKVYLDQVTWDKDGWPVMHNMRPTVKAARPTINQPNGITATESANGKDGVATVSPRKVHDKLTVSAKTNGRFTWQIVSLHGETVKSGKAGGTVTIDVNDIRNGLYIVNVKTKHGSTSEKIIKY